MVKENNERNVKSATPTFNIPVIHNIRSPKQWEIISSATEFDDKNVIDLGCGYGDVLWRSALKSKMSWGVEQDGVICRDLWTNISRYKDINDVKIYNTPIENFIKIGSMPMFDISICFSVLPYLDQKDACSILAWMAANSNVSFVECQYHKDGPGPEWLMGSADMHLWLSDYFSKCCVVGQTTVTYRKINREIWMCYNN